MMSLDDVVKVLQVGFSGFAFLMAGLSFRLLRAEARRDGTPRKQILAAIQRYTAYTFILAVLVLVSRLSEQAYAAHVEEQKSESIRRAGEAEVCRDGLTRLITADARVAKDRETLLLAIQQGVVGCRTVLKWLERGQKTDG